MIVAAHHWAFVDNVILLTMLGFGFSAAHLWFSAMRRDYIPYAGRLMVFLALSYSAATVFWAWLLFSHSIPHEALNGFVVALSIPILVAGPLVDVIIRRMSERIDYQDAAISGLMNWVESAREKLK